VSGSFSVSTMSASTYQISGTTVIDSARQIYATAIGLTGPGNFAAQGYVQADGGFRVSGSQGVNRTFTSADGKTVTVTGGIITSVFP
jgi:hypothetical protein